MKYEYDKNLFIPQQQREINKAIEYEITEEIFKLITKTNKNNIPIFNSSQIHEIIHGWLDGHTNDEIMFYAQFNDEEIPIFSAQHMTLISSSLQIGISKEFLSDTLAATKNGTALFNKEETRDIFIFIHDADDKQKQQLKEYIKDGLSFELFGEFLDTDITADQMRVYRSFCDLGCTGGMIARAVMRELDYKELKDIKYLLQCAKELDINFEHLFRGASIGYNSIKDKLLNQIPTNSTPVSVEFKDVIDRCLKHKIPPGQIEFLVNCSGLDAQKAEAIAIGFLNDLNMNEIRGMVVSNFLFDSKYLKESIDKAIEEKRTIGVQINEETNFESDLSEEVSIDEL